MAVNSKPIEEEQKEPKKEKKEMIRNNNIKRYESNQQEERKDEDELEILSDDGPIRRNSNSIRSNINNGESLLLPFSMENMEKNSE